MRKLIHIAVAMLLGFSFTGCREEILLSHGEGTLVLNTSIQSKVDIVSRALTSAEEQSLADEAVIQIYNKDGVLHEYIGTSNIPSELRLLSGSYSAAVWTGDSVPASWDKTYYRSDIVGFDIASGKNTDLTLNCIIANTFASVSFTQSALEKLASPELTVALADGVEDGSHSLEFDESKSGIKGRFMINSRTKGLVWTLKGTKEDGTEFVKQDTIKNIKHATEYRITVNYADQDFSVGGSYFNIEIEEEPIGEEHNIEVHFPPTIVGMLGFDKNNSFSGEEGKIDRKTIWISAASAFEEVIFTSDRLQDIIGSNNIELVFLSGKDMEQTLHDAGINWYFSEDTQNGMSGLRINLEEEFTNSLPEGDHTFTVEAKDSENKKSTATFTISVTNAPVAISPVDNSSLTYTSARLQGKVLKDAAEYGFEIREASESRAYETWTRIPATVSGNTIYADVNDLRVGAKYEYRVYADDFVSEETQSFSTLDLQLENSGFEDWYEGKVAPSNNAKGWFPVSDPDNIFWDCGNHGSLTVGGNITNRTSDVKQSGNYAIEMKSQLVVIKFAAGNAFYGKYLKTDGTDGILGFGRPWPDVRPRQLKGYVKYTPEVIDKDAGNLPAGAALQKGDDDQGIIYIALLSDDKSVQGDPEYPDYPVVVRTKTKKFFNPQASNVIAYGEMIFNATSGSDMQDFTININDVNPGQKIAYIMVVCSASRYGDYFAGGRGSTMWLDDLQLVY